MGDEQYVIELEGADTEGQAMTLKFAPEDDAGWLQQELRREPGSAKLRLRVVKDEAEDDTEGHRARLGTSVRVMAESDDDTEGHAISIRFPSLEEADAFRRRLLATGVIVASVAVAATVGGALASQSSTDAAGTGAAAVTSVSGEYAADRGIGIAPAAAAGATSVSGEYASDRGVGIAPAAAAGATSVSGEYASDRGVGIAPAAAAGATSVSGEYASDRGVGIAPASASDDEDAGVPEHRSGPGPAPR